MPELAKRPLELYDPDKVGKLRGALFGLVEAIERCYPAQSDRVREQVTYAKEALREF